MLGQLLDSDVRSERDAVRHALDVLLPVDPATGLAALFAHVVPDGGAELEQARRDAVLDYLIGAPAPPVAAPPAPVAAAAATATAGRTWYCIWREERCAQWRCLC